MIYVCRIYAKLQIFYLQDSNLYWSLIELGDPNRLMPRPPILHMLLLLLLLVVAIIIIRTTMDELVGLLQFGCCNLSLLNLSVVWGQRSW